MSDDKMTDKDGVVYEKGWDGKYHPKEGFFGVEQDVDFFGNAKTQTDFLGNPVEETNFWEGSVKSSDGKQLYRPASSTAGTTSGENALAAILGIVVIAMGLMVAGFLITPILAPILLGFMQSARKKGDWATVKNLEIFSVIASIIAILVVLGIAGAIGVALASGIVQLAQANNYMSGFIYLLAGIVGLIVFGLSFVTGISPTAILYLNSKEMQLIAASNIAKASQVKQINSVIRVVAISTVVLVFISVCIAIIVGVFSITTFK